MKDIKLHEYMDMPDSTFPIKFLDGRGKIGTNLMIHWHEHMELLLFTEGKAFMQCDKNGFYAEKGTLVVSNCNDIHTWECLEVPMSYDCLILDMSLIKSSFLDSTQVKYITPIIENKILFKNEIVGDDDLICCVQNIIDEYKQQTFGYELAIKAELFKFFSILIRKHVDKILTPQEYAIRMKTLERFKTVFDFVIINYQNQITIEQISKVVNLSPYYFCRMFKESTGRTFVDYLNNFRIDKAEQFLTESDINVTEAALSCGYNDINYFSRMFKRYKNMSPSNIKHKLR